MAYSRSDWVALARKYWTMAELRRTQHQTTGAEARGPLRVLSREFPGSLRELDLLPLDQIEARATRFERAAEGGPIEPWMEWMMAYHATMRAALDVKRELGGRRSLSRSDAGVIAARTAPPGSVRVDAEFVLAVAMPPRGRLNAIVFECLEAHFEAREGSIDQALFPAVGGRGPASQPAP